MKTSSFIKNILFVLILISSCSYGYAQLSKKHFIPPLTSGPSNADPQDQWIYISTPNNSLVPYTIIPVGDIPANYITGTVSNAFPQRINAGFGTNTQLFQDASTTSTVTNNKGYIIEAEAPIYVSVRMNAGNAQAGALVSKGLSALDNTFRIGTYTSENPQNNYVSFVSVMATEDNTVVNFDNLPAGLIIENYTGATPVLVNLNEGESYTIAINVSDNGPSINNLMDGLIGTLVTSNNPIVVNCGSANGSFDNGSGRDYGIDQIAGLSKIGNEYIFVKGAGNDAWENVLIVAHSDNTTININGNAPVTTINAGEYHVIEGNNYSSNDNMYVETSNNVFAYQGVGSNNEANQGMFFVPPLSCETRGNIDNIASIDEIGSLVFNGGVSIVTKTGATVTVNNLPLTNFATVGPSAVTGKPDYITYKVTGLTGNVSVQGDDELYVAYFNVNGAATSGSFYSGFPSNPEINFDLQFSALGNCIPNVTLEAANAQNFDTYQWFYDDGSGAGFQSLAINVTSITPTTPARYKLIGTITCTGENFDSIEVPVSICPDDIDNDGIIDNLDIDNDNDGILNCIESRGDVTLNISNETNPILVFQDASTNNSIASASYTETSSSGNTNIITGENSGNFTSVIGNAASAEGDYTINYTEPVNVKITEHTTITNTPTLGETFVLRIAPANKNITLIDPDNRLLVDSNFDGLFEAGVTQISGSEIHFQVNPTPNGNTPYQFLANSVEGISFIHRLQNATDPSTFSANISLTCFKNDNDNDGVKDELDLDSDNDGIPDFIENTGTLVALSGIDADANGLDDIYNINTTPLDTDNDTVLDFYDLDSDNDGIYDLLETGEFGVSLIDINLDGIEDGSNFGINGWADAAETTPDSNLINYILDDFDSDSIFSYIDADSDGDTCSDVIEANFSDGNNDTFLGDSAPTTDNNGLVNNASDGYTIPNADYLDFAPITIDNLPLTPVICENSNFSIQLDSPDAETIQWEISTDNGVNWAAMVDDATFTGTNTFTLNITNAPLAINNYIFRAFLNRAGNTCGLYSSNVSITVDVLPIANTASTMQLCDDDNNGTMPFDLTLQNNTITTATGMTITYHETQTDADNNTNPITSSFESGNTTIYARVENNANTTCYDTSSFNLEIYESPFPLLNVTPLQECDDNSIGTDVDGLKIFDLTQKETEILNGQNNADFTLTYYTDAGFVNQINTPTTFANTVSGTQPIYVRMTNNTYNSCVAETSFNVEVFSLPIVNIPNTYMQCDDASNDGQAFFNLTLDLIKDEINPNHVAENLTFTYHLTQIDAQNSISSIPTPENYQDALGFAPETVWVRVENPNGCYREVPLVLTVSPSSTALSTYTPTSIYQCDDGLDERDGISTFNFTHIRDHISTTIFSTFNVTVHFYETQMDAELEINEIPDIANHQNTNSINSQSIWVRVKSNLGNNCLGLEELPNLLMVETLPIANPVFITRQCDFDITDTLISYPFDTSQVENDVLNGQLLTDVTITYNYLDITGTSVSSNTLPNPFLTESQTITITVTNNTTQDPDGACSDETTLEFIVDDQPIISSPIAPQIFCDGEHPDDLDDNDGMFPFDTSNFAATILGTQSNTMEISFNYISEDGSLVFNSPTLPNPLISSNQTIQVSIFNPLNDSCITSTTIILRVNSLPQFSFNEKIVTLCGNPFNPYDIIPIEDSSLTPHIYQWTYQDNTVVANTLILPRNTILQYGTGEYTLTITNSDSFCSNQQTLVIKAADPPNLSITDIDINDFVANNTVTIIDPSSLGNSTYMFALVDNNGAIVFPYQENPVFNNVRPGFYTLLAQDIEQICDEIGVPISVIGYKKFFTPNNDGYNDTWKIIGVNDLFQTNSSILIFDRYGKLLKQISTLEEGWDGTSRGTRMPTDDYWFKVFLEDGRVYSGHFTLKR